MRTLVEAHRSDPDVRFTRSGGVSGQDTCPRITRVEPDHGTAGDQVEIYGTGLPPSTRVRWGDQIIMVSVVDGTGTLIVPPSENEQVDVEAADRPDDLPIEDDRPYFTYDAEPQPEPGTPTPVVS